METPKQEWERHIEQEDWETLGITEEEEEVIEDLLSKHICNYCRGEVYPDIGQSEIFCPHCQMITRAIRA